MFYDPKKVNLIFASESFQHYPGQTAAVQGNNFLGNIINNQNLNLFDNSNDDEFFADIK